MTYPNKSQLAFIKSNTAVDEVEAEGLDEGRFFVHLKEGYDWSYDPMQPIRTKSFNTFAQVKIWLKRIKVVAVNNLN